MEDFNIYNLEGLSKDAEYFSTIISGKSTRIEKIISCGQTTKKDEWLSEGMSEFVILLQGEAEILFKDNKKVRMKKGDYIIINPGQEHQVTYTSQEPPCIWLAVYFG